MLAKQWTCIGFVDDVVPNSTQPVDLLGLPLLIVRDKAGTSRVFHNVCRHRGHRLVSESKALSSAGIVCPYHCWVYGVDGALKRTPHIGGPKKHEIEGFDKSKRGLFKVRCETWMGMIFVNVSGDAPDMDKHLSPLLKRWSEFVDKNEYENLRPADQGGAFEIEVQCNWKLAVENYLESYHLPMVHPELNTYSKLEDHYNIMVDEMGGGQGSTAFRFAEKAGLSLPHFHSWPEARKANAEYIALYPNVLLGLQVDHVFAVILLPTTHTSTRELFRIFYVGDEATADLLKDMRIAVLEGWRAVFAEDIGVVEGMQQGRASPAFDGGVFSPVMDNATHHFHRWVAGQVEALPL